MSGRALRYLEPRFERASRAEMTRWQTARLREQTAHAYRNSPFYRSKLRDAGVKPSAIRSQADLARMPYTNKDELKEERETKDPIRLLGARLDLDDDEFARIDAELTAEVEAAVEFAKAGTDPKPEDALKYVYA